MSELLAGARAQGRRASAPGMLPSGSTARRHCRQPPGCGVRAGIPWEPCPPPLRWPPIFYCPGPVSRCWHQTHPVAGNSPSGRTPPGLGSPCHRGGTPGVAAAAFIGVHPAEPHGSAAPLRASTQRQTWTNLRFRVVI